eukprot:SAG22_NODE_955_length_6331_cov_21.329108_11_plen_124_part_00
MATDRRLMIRGMFSLPLLGMAPSLATFFGLYTPLRCWAGEGNPAGVLAASVVAAVPASAVRIPADVLQKRVVLGVDRCVSLCESGWRNPATHRTNEPVDQRDWNSCSPAVEPQGKAEKQKERQ